MEKQYLKEREVSERYGFSMKTLQNWRHQGCGPVFHKIRGFSVRYRVSDIEAFMQQGRVDTGRGNGEV